MIQKTYVLNSLDKLLNWLHASAVSLDHSTLDKVAYRNMITNNQMTIHALKDMVTKENFMRYKENALARLSKFENWLHTTAVNMDNKTLDAVEHRNMITNMQENLNQLSTIVKREDGVNP